MHRYIPPAFRAAERETGRGRLAWPAAAPVLIGLALLAWLLVLLLVRLVAGPFS